MMKRNQTIGKTLCTKCGKASCCVSYWTRSISPLALASKEQAIRACTQDMEDRIRNAR